MLPILVTNGKPVACPAAMANAVATAYVPSNPHARTFLLGIQAQYNAAVAAIKTITVKTGPTSADGLLTATVLSIGSTDTSVATTAFQFLIDRVAYAKAAVAAGTALAAGTIPQDKWGIYRLVIGTNGTIDVLAGAANFTTGYDDEAAAIAALPAVTASHVDMGHFAVLTAVGSPFVGNTDALEGGASGNPSSDTNYYPASAITLTQVGLPIRWDFTNGPFVGPVPGILHTERDQALVVELEASGAATTGEVVAWVAAP